MGIYCLALADGKLVYRDFSAPNETSNIAKYSRRLNASIWLSKWHDERIAKFEKTLGKYSKAHY
ncbi:hypothetical protein CQ010_02140 [Arthrobacter sp. MYb211]|nr:hypothetical protein CQ019_12840 [Arthrobacter sp. MYb229]PRA13467.1 hypothetical protein CQ015_04395 [Arthrobacter sp. MYb221]PRB50707.1 hypothetical protein CQ013_11985 [Arthrobacter sp. MYb216]PRC10666.1 hypothetical protein CQ010_02140 [Arthrobacter sp. MYb211]